ncbi:methyl-accepting chemotaxis protein [Cellvibrio japonicus]|uniref:Twitching motility protein PilJ n=1 Tax=Cellvibrio japonicus (strain Ueda107) TaxID=498211 RepID=B3PFG0_CELJU|nr:methyl-accepting chemotaxis protein [Cellvibrio japonicus]ACE85963.1 twitching motility protein PilJ [Cellvibrio japonicus Ueda107]QEI10831.1 methyl-accepting chemotaxis protein [Cellvibrio japonicus]QEI14407.1 methyl-accepting chemotaxis protein [Cellvibrio japonicus]QEI17985.1 methyl-accepting chemotaxis protein [Cellvibrio japonicus]
MKTDSKITAFRAKPAMVVAVAVLVLSIILMVIAFIIVQRDAANDQRYVQQVADLRAQAYQLTSLSRDATSGDDKAFDELNSVVTGMGRTWDTLRASDERTRRVLSPEFSNYEGIWGRVKTNAQAIATNKDLIVSLNNVGKTLNENLPTLQTEHNNIVDILLESNAPAEQAIQAQLLSWRAERIGRNVDKMLRGDADASEAADQFNRDANFYSRVLTAMKSGDVMLGISRVTDNNARASLDQITNLFEGVNKSIQEMFEGSTTLFRARQAAEALLTDTPQLLQALASIQDKISVQANSRFPNNYHILACAGLALIALFFIGFNLYRGARLRADETAETNERNQTAILRLLDELADLADGDLTTTATVTEDFTGAIADSINFTIDQLRILVARINETAVNVSAAAQETQQTALHLAEASEHQAQEIAGASAAVNEMAVTIDQVSANAAESAAVAERAVSIASNGAKVVQNTIHGMDTIREQIQDTSKRIKRLGESSQEIGDIVSLINDIADQTNILALNAAIQASMAGDAGRGFAVVADEVQRLAERSAAATKQIEALVKTIQNDTNEAVISMEQTTSEVVRGARLAQDAGVALEEIENVSTSLAELIQNISNAARQQASSAGHISNTMNVIQEITTQTSAGTSATAQSIGHLAEMALDLRESVAGFKLPEEDMSEARAQAAQAAMAKAPAMDFEQPEELEEIIDLDDELLPEDDVYPQTSRA